MLILLGIIILLFIILTSIKYGNEDHRAQRMHSKEYTDKVVNNMSKLLK